MLPSDAPTRADALLVVIGLALVVALAATYVAALPLAVAGAIGVALAGAALVDGLLVHPPSDG